jgi:hypothetical protein
MKMILIIVPELNEKLYEMSGWGKISKDMDNSLEHSHSCKDDNVSTDRKSHLVWKVKADFRVRKSRSLGHNLKGPMKPTLRIPYF